MAHHINLFNQNDMEDLRVNFEKLMKILQRKANRNFGRTVSVPIGDVVDLDGPLMQEFVSKLKTAAHKWLDNNKLYDEPNKYAEFRMYSARNYVKHRDASGFELNGEWLTTYVFALRYFEETPPTTIGDAVEFPNLPQPSED